MSHSPRFVPCALLLLTAAAGSAQTVRIEFEHYPGPDGVLGTLDDVPITAPSTFAAQPLQLVDEFMQLGVRFIPNPAINDKNEILNSSSFATPPSHTPANILVSSGSLTIDGEFLVPVFSVTALIGISGGSDDLEIFDVGGVSLGLMNGDDVEVTLTSLTPIARFQVRASGSTTPAIDNLEFGVGSATIGASYCGPAVVNSSGAGAVLVATGSTVAMNNNVTLSATGVPVNMFCLFISSQSQALVMNPGGSAGNLCLGGAIGRYLGSGQVQNSGTTGSVSLALNLLQTPTPNSFVSIVSGETWNFQVWFRDLVAGAPSSNFSQGVSISFL